VPVRFEVHLARVQWCGLRWYVVVDVVTVPHRTPSGAADTQLGLH
jgi:hypothetical protein